MDLHAVIWMFFSLWRLIFVSPPSDLLTVAYTFSTGLTWFSHSAGLQVPSRLQQSFLTWKKRLPQKATPSLCVESPNDLSGMVNSVSFPPVLGQKGRLRAESCADQRIQATNHSIGKMSRLHSLSRILSHPSASVNPRENLKKPRKQRHPWLHAAPERDSDSILSLHTQLYYLESYTNTIKYEPLPLLN